MVSGFDLIWKYSVGEKYECEWKELHIRRYNAAHNYTPINRILIIHNDWTDIEPLGNSTHFVRAWNWKTSWERTFLWNWFMFDFLFRSLLLCFVTFFVNEIPHSASSFINRFSCRHACTLHMFVSFFYLQSSWEICDDIPRWQLPPYKQKQLLLRHSHSQRNAFLKANSWHSKNKQSSRARNGKNVRIFRRIININPAKIEFDATPCER